ncbi:YitT family protein [Kitasatospora sp. NPDC094019]|uniref:membrane protein YczE n=1 Tax=Kitasatospora sp. NPDC094019 TaxID=3364091 RepID=UPI003812E360
MATTSTLPSPSPSERAPSPSPSASASASASSESASPSPAAAAPVGARPGPLLRVLGDTHALGRRLPQLAVGLALYGGSMGLMLRSGLGLDPWDVFHQGLQGSFGLSVGAWVTICGALVLLLWIPLRQLPGVGTVANVLLIGGAMDLTLRFVGSPEALPARIATMVAAIVLNGLATGLYIGARLGAGPRDGLMTGLHRRTGGSLRLIRTGIELVVLAVGVLLGGTAGVGTVAYALAIGPLAQFFLPWCTVPTAEQAGRAGAAGPTA